MFIFALSLVAVGCHAQTPPPSTGALSADLTRRVELLIRSRSDVTEEYEIQDGASDEERGCGI